MAQRAGRIVVAMSDIMTKWVVSQSHTVDAPSALTDEAVEVWIRDACDAFLNRCARLLATRDAEGLSLVAEVGTFAAATLGSPRRSRRDRGCH